MRKTLISIVAALACVFASAQDDAAAFKARYERQVRNVGAAGVGVETILTRWEEAFPEDPAVMEGFYKFWFAKSLGSAVVTRDTRRYLGKDPMFSLRDSTGKERFYFEDNVFVDSLFALSQTYIDRAIATEPCELSYRVDKVTSLMLYEKESPDMATQELLKLIDFQRKSHPEWTYLGLAVDDATFVQTIQEYCHNFFQYATPGSYDAFKTVSEAMLKLYPKDTSFINNIGSYWLVYKQNPRKALQWYNKALKIDPKDYNAAKNCVILARKEKDSRLEKKYLPYLIAATDSDLERSACEARLESLTKKK